MDNDNQEKVIYNAGREIVGWLDKSIAAAKAKDKARREHTYTLAEIEALLTEITAGDWIACHDGECSCGMVYGGTGEMRGSVLVHIATDHDDEDIIPNREQQIANARFISRVPAIIRQLLAGKGALDSETKPQDDYRVARGILGWKEGDEPAEVSIRRLRHDAGEDMQALYDIFETLHFTEGFDAGLAHLVIDGLAITGAYVLADSETTEDGTGEGCAGNSNLNP